MKEVDVLPMPHKFVDAEMIRDGGSLTKTFETQDRQRFILAVKIVMPALQSQDITVLQRAASYDAPVLIEPDKRPPDTSELSGEASPLSWADASVLVNQAASLPHDLSELRLKWFNSLKDVVERQGRPLSPE